MTAFNDILYYTVNITKGDCMMTCRCPELTATGLMIGFVVGLFIGIIVFYLMNRKV